MNVFEFKSVHFHPLQQRGLVEAELNLKDIIKSLTLKQFVVTLLTSLNCERVAFTNFNDKKCVMRSVNRAFFVIMEAQCFLE